MIAREPEIRADIPGSLACLTWNSMWVRLRGHPMAWAQLTTREHPSQTVRPGQGFLRFLGDLPPARTYAIRSGNKSRREAPYLNQGDHLPANVRSTRVDSLTATRPAFRHPRLLISGSHLSAAHAGTQNPLTPRWIGPVAWRPEGTTGTPHLVCRLDGGRTCTCFPNKHSAMWIDGPGTDRDLATKLHEG